MGSVAATLVESEEPGSIVIAAAGNWLVTAAVELDRRLRGIRVPPDKRVTLDLAGVERLDTAGAWLLLRTEHELAAHGNAVEFRNLRPNFAPLFGRAVSLLNFFGVICMAGGRVLLHPRRLRLTALVAQMEQTGVNAVPIVG